MKTFRTTISVFIMILCGAIGIYFGGYFNDAIGGCILGVLISGIACIIYVLDNQDNKGIGGFVYEKSNSRSSNVN